MKFRDIRKRTGAILDALVAEGANQINGPNLTIDKPEAAYDEARVKAIAAGRARAELYARALGKRVVRLLSVSESGGYSAPPPMPYARDMAVQSAAVVEDRNRSGHPGTPSDAGDELRASIVKKRAARVDPGGPSFRIPFVA